MVPELKIKKFFCPRNFLKPVITPRRKAKVILFHLRVLTLYNFGRAGFHLFPITSYQRRKTIRKRCN